MKFWQDHSNDPLLTQISNFQCITNLQPYTICTIPTRINSSLRVAILILVHEYSHSISLLYNIINQNGQISSNHYSTFYTGSSLDYAEFLSNHDINLVTVGNDIHLNVSGNIAADWNVNISISDIEISKFMFRARCLEHSKLDSSSLKEISEEEFIIGEILES